MSKEVDWNRHYKGAIRGNRGKYGSYKGLLQKAEEAKQEAQSRIAQFKKMEPYLRKALLDRMLGKEVIKVLAPFNNLEDKLVKGPDGNSQSYQTVNEPIPGGTKLIYDHWDRTMGQWIFRTQADDFGKCREVAIYDKPMLVLGTNPATGQPVQAVNTGFFGLLTHTDIFKSVLEELAAKEGGDEEA